RARARAAGARASLTSRVRALARGGGATRAVATGALRVLLLCGIPLPARRALALCVGALAASAAALLLLGRARLGLHVRRDLADERGDRRGIRGDLPDRGLDARLAHELRHVLLLRRQHE